MPRRLRLLGLHGYHGSSESLRHQLRPLAAALEPAELVCVDAPSLAEGDFGWWHANGTRYCGLPLTLRRLAAFCRSAGPFDGVLGFSQGAALAALLVALCARDPAAMPRFDFAMLIGGFESRDADHAAALDVTGGIARPSMHIIGRTDSIVAPRASNQLASRFRAPLIVEHDGGHVIPGSPDVHAAVTGFLHAMARRPPLYHHRVIVSEVSLWPGRAQPVMRVFLPDSDQPRPALVIFRGGGYARSDGSGAGSGAWAARNGMVGIEVDYGTRATQASYPQPYADAARAVRLTRAHARDWGIDPARVGVLGYSAGGHLASLLATQPALYTSPDDDLASHISARPDFVVLAYPLISFVDHYAPGAFAGSVENFFGYDGAPEALRRQFSSELHVESTHPPVFLWTTADDALVPASHSQRFADACRRAGVPISFRLFAHGPHGMGLALDEPGEVGKWTTQLLKWLDTLSRPHVGPP